MHEKQARRRSFLGSFFCAFLCLFVAIDSGCKKRETDVARGIREQVLHRGLGTDLATLDPHLITILPEINVASALFEGLVAEDPIDGHPVPGVAERWETSADGLTWTFHLRGNARWSNGEPVTATDFARSIQRALDPALTADNSAMLFVLAGAEAWHQGGSADFSRVGVRVLDAQTLQLTLAHPAPYLPSLLAHPIWYPVYLPALEKAGGATKRDSTWTNPETFVGNGPFVLKANRRGQVIIVEKSPTYWDAATVRLNAIHFHPAEDRESEERAYRSGQLHLTDALPVGKVDAWRRDTSGVLRITPFLDTYFYRLNTTRPGLDNKLVRQALSLALDRRAITEKIIRGGQQPAHSLVPPAIQGYAPPDALREDLAEAGRLLAAAGYPEGKGLPPLEILVNSSGNHRVIAEAIQQMWRRLGVQVEINNMEQASLLARRRTLDYSVMRAEWVADFDDAKSFLDIFRGGSSNNHTGWASLRYDALLHEADRTADPAARQHTVIVIEDASMPRRDRIFRMQQFDMRAIALRRHARRHRRTHRARLHGADKSIGLRREPVHVAHEDGAGRQRRARTHDHARIHGIDLEHEQRLFVAGKPKALALADGEMDHAIMAGQNFALLIDDVAGLHGAGIELLDNARVIAVRHETDVLAVRLVGNNQPEFNSDLAHIALGHAAQRKAHEIQLLARGAKKKVALVARRIGGDVQFRAVHAVGPSYIMTGGQRVGAKFFCRRQQVGELHLLVAGDAGDRRFAARIGGGKIFHHRFFETRFVIQNVVRNAERLRNAARVVNVLAGAASAFFLRSGAGIVELQRHADDVIAFALEQRGGDGGIHATGHGNDHAGVARVLRKSKAVAGGGHGGAYKPAPPSLQPLA